MTKIVLKQLYEIEIPKSLQSLNEDQLLNKLNSLYDIYGKGIIDVLNAENEYFGTVLHSIDDQYVLIQNDKISHKGGQEIFLDGQPRD